MGDIICFGEVLWDKLPRGKQPGGAPLNVALHLVKHGFRSKLISSVGHDEDGRALLEYMQQGGLQTDYIQTHKSLPTGVVNVQLDEQGQASYEIVSPVAWDAIQITDAYIQTVKEAEAFVFGTLAAREEDSRKTLLHLLEHSRLKVLDLNLRVPHFELPLIEQLLTSCNILKINEHELEFLRNKYNLLSDSVETQLKELSLAKEIPIICVTLGDKGAAVLDNDTFLSHPGYVVKVADTIGAGDSFLAAFLAAYLKQEPLNTCLALACASGALVASKQGANPQYSLEDVIEFAQT